MRWKDLLDEIVNKNDTTISAAKSISYAGCTRESKRYRLGDGFGEVYFTEREAQTMMHVLLGKTFNATAEAMNLSPRTIEFYLDNMKLKLNCRTKQELIEKVMASEFVRYLGSKIEG